MLTGKMEPDFKIIDQHSQETQFSCVPSAIEMVLKLEGKIQVTEYPLQNRIEKDRKNGSLGDYDNKELYGLKFTRKYALRKGNDFPLDKLFSEIDSELDNGRYVIISIDNPGGWHMYVIYNYSEKDDEYYGFSKNGFATIEIKNIKSIVKQMKGADILTYTKTTVV